ncbi:winged helix-turn-helix transcriptional regulator [Streptomyces sp. NPDC058690]|uniref:winged helix-turn-helix transcriptional regulator n=1 Tax=Streptomyces sp. NPDC058690 TaxID=3346600 RepID=UPI0036523B4B
MPDPPPVTMNALSLSPSIAGQMLTLTLKYLQRSGLVDRTAYAEVPPRVEYSLAGPRCLPALRHRAPGRLELRASHRGPTPTGRVRQERHTQCVTDGRSQSLLLCMTVAPQAGAGATSAQTLTPANRQLVDLDTGRFVSCPYAHIDLAPRPSRVQSHPRIRVPLDLPCPHQVPLKPRQVGLRHARSEPHRMPAIRDGPHSAPLPIALGLPGYGSRPLPQTAVRPGCIPDSG